MLQIDESKLEEGAHVADRYRLDHVLGEGGMGVVWSATDERSGEIRALKFIRRDKCGDGRSVARLLREAHAASTVAHPNVARVFEVLELPEGTPFLVMEHLEGETLSSRLARKSIGPAEASRLVAAIAHGVRAAHALGIVHRDLKPDNVFILGDGTVKVIDFGIAKDLRTGADTDLTATGAMLGTLHYMAPEQVFGDVDVDERADVWALGVVLYECVAGRRPTEGSGSGQVLKAIMTGTFPTLVDAAPGCPEALSDLVREMLSRDRAERPTLDDVIDVLEGRPSQRPSRKPALASEVLPLRTPWTRRRVLVVGTAITFALGIAGAGAGIGLRDRGAPATATASATASIDPPTLSATSVSSLSTASFASVSATAASSLPSSASASASLTSPRASVSAKASSAPRLPPSAVTPGSAPTPPPSAPSVPPIATSRRM